MKLMKVVSACSFGMRINPNDLAAEDARIYPGSIVLAIATLDTKGTRDYLCIAPGGRKGWIFETLLRDLQDDC